jgi:RNA polymerase sigma-70 factor (ECF subfamily)
MYCAETQQLIEAAQAGCSRSLNELLTRHVGLMRSTIGRMVRGADVDDCCQESMIRVMRYLRGYQPTGSFEAWLCRIARNTTLNHIRDANRAAAETLGEWAEQVADPGKRPDELLIAQDRAAAVRSAVAKLPAKQREMVELLFLEELDKQDAMAVGGVNCQTTVRTRLIRARQSLRATLSFL